MIIHLEQLGEETFQWQEDLQLTPGELKQSDIVSLGRVDCQGQISRTSSGFYLRESLTYLQMLSCTRCLGDIKENAKAEIDLLVLVGQQESNEELQLSSEDLGVLYLPEPILDTRPLLLEQLHLGVPLKTLCREDCAGLCEECGGNLNQNDCGCKLSIDPRWAALQDLKQRKI